MHAHDRHEHGNDDDEHAALGAGLEDHAEAEEVKQPHRADVDQRHRAQFQHKPGHRPRHHDHGQRPANALAGAERFALPADQPHGQCRDHRRQGRIDDHYRNVGEHGDKRQPHGIKRILVGVGRGGTYTASA